MKNSMIISTDTLRDLAINYMAEVWSKSSRDTGIDAKRIILANARTSYPSQGIVEIKCGKGVGRAFDFSLPLVRSEFERMVDRAEREDLIGTGLLEGGIEIALASRNDDSLGYLVTRLIPTTNYNINWKTTSRQQSY
jgi:hypothetical protein